MNATIIVTPEQLPEAMQAKLTEFLGEVQLAMELAAHQGVAILVNKAISEKVVDLGTYMQGFTVHKTPDGAIITNEAPHALIVEEGSKPHFPPPQPILEYMSRKMGGPATIDVSDSTRYDLADAAIFKDDSKLEGIRQAALSVCRKIGTQGTEPTHLIQRSLDEIMDAIKSELRLIGVT